MNVLKNFAIFAAFIVLAFVVVLCWDAVGDALPFGGAASVMYGVGCVVLFIVLLRKRGLPGHHVRSGPGPDENEPADPEDRARTLEQIRKSIRDRKKQDGDFLI